eukprot:UN2253
MSAASEDTRPADESEWPRSPRVDDAMDEVTRHLMHARDKVEAVELEFAQIMSELANYGERWGEGPPPTDAWEDASYSSPVLLHQHADAEQAGHVPVCTDRFPGRVGTPAGAHQIGPNTAGVTAELDLD